MRHLLLVWTVVSVLVLPSAGCSRACDQVAGIVVDGDGTPLPSATVVLAPRDTMVLESDLITEDCAQDGTFTAYSCANTRDSYFTLTTECSGFQTDVRIVKSGDAGLMIVLKRETRVVDG
ncbi:hypothetical protein K227x_23280 [Rubripirellula lacrimiformis]|uniref:Carboxypeptidase regulatory-like domain-containing protein n=1 Tax=Rubripirellula lacrimiformis TaxID=1930273 RepID=A0A517N9Y8_9BACT|nr:hypothetical protein [Rubripirellula lacrimiformis]QDT03942.1 hypothetical protein K227x_23280 [Rubripirellula lacrimiformis]